MNLFVLSAGKRHVIVHQRRIVKLTDCKVFGFNAVLEVEVRVLRCKSCGETHVEKIAIQSKHGVQLTSRLEDEVIKEMEDTGSIKATSSRLGIGWNTCKKVHKRYLQRTISFDLGDAQFLAIDEFSIAKGHTYATVVVDIVSRRVLWVGKGKKISDVDRFFKLCGKVGCEQIKAVAMDENAGFANCVKRFLS